MRDFKKVFRRLAVTTVLAVFVMASAIPSLAATYQDGTYSVPVSLSGGSGKNTVVSPCTVTVSGGQIHATVIFSKVSKAEPPRYTYLTTSAGTVYPQTYGAYSQIFYNVPLPSLGSVQAKMETSIMANLHTIDYVLYFDDSAIPTVGGSTGDNSAASNGSSGDAKASEKKHEDTKDDKAKENSKESKDDKSAKASDKSKKADKKAAKKADDKKTSAKASDSKNSKLALYIGGLVVSLGVAGVGIFMLLKIGKKK